MQGAWETMELSIDDRKRLIGVIRDLFASVAELAAFIRDNTGRNVQEIVNDNLNVTRSALVDNALRHEWLGELVEALKDIAGSEARRALDSINVPASFSPPQEAGLRAAIQQSLPVEDLRVLLYRLRTVAGGEMAGALAAPHIAQLAEAVRAQIGGRPELRKPLEEIGVLAETPPNLQKIVNDANGFLNLGLWLSRLTEIEGYVCRLAIDTPVGLKAKGSGVLVGPSTVLTNYHVVAEELVNASDPKRLRVQFDYRVLRDGSVSSGTVVALDQTRNDSWRIGYAPFSRMDGRVHPLEEEPEVRALDYALLRLDKPVGALPIGAVVADGAVLPRRGWLDLTQHGAVGDGAAIFIVQHPSGLPIKLALDTKGVIGYSPNRRRLRYRTNTLSGSSGSPVFNQDLEIVALHHSGDPAYPLLQTGQYNEGIPIPALLDRFTRDGSLAKLAD